MFTKKPVVAFYELAAQEYLADAVVGYEPDDYTIHIQSSTGTGKSTYVMRTLSQSSKVIFAVPQRAQVDQLKGLYSQSDIACEFMYGGETSGQNIKTADVTICTYDCLELVLNRVDPAGYTLVIDEAHKLYQAANYRNRAINSVIHHAKYTKFKRVITLSAKLNLDLVPIDYDKIVEISSASVERKLNINFYKSKSQRDEYILNHAVKHPDGVVMFRINDLDALKYYKSLIEASGKEVLLICSDVQRSADIQSMFSSGTIPEKYDVVMSTSLTDEAIDINNTNIGAVHIVGGKMHSEEMLQFMGRFRRQAPTFHQHLIKEDIRFVESDLKAEREALVSIARSLIDIKKVSDELSGEYAKDAVTRFLNGLSGRKGVSLVQATRSDQGKETLEVDYAGINNALYQLDSQQHYSTLEALKSRFREAIPGLSISVVRDLKPTTKRFKAELNSAHERVEAQYQAVVDGCAEAIGLDNAELDDAQRTEVLATFYLNQEKGIDAWHVSAQWMQLMTSSVQRHEDAYAVLKARQFEDVRDYTHDVTCNPMVLSVLLALQKRPPGIMTLLDAKDIIVKAFRRLFKFRPELKQLIAKLNKAHGIVIKSNNHIWVSDALVRRFFRLYTSCEIKRSDNVYRIVYEHVNPFPYRLKFPLFHTDLTEKEEVNMLCDKGRFEIAGSRFLTRRYRAA